jgi:hypothetical protein
LEEAGVDGKVILKWILNEFGQRAWTRLIWPRTGAGGGPWRMRWCIRGLHKMLEISGLAEEL